MANSIINAALVGCGVISGAHMRAWQHVTDSARVTVCCDVNGALAAQTAEKWNARSCVEFQMLLDDPAIQAVDLCLPHHLHAEYAIRAMNAGKHVLCEKPLAISVQDCRAMIDASVRSGVVLMHGENMRFAATIAMAADAAASGEIGDLVGVQAAYSHYQRAEMNSGWRGDLSLAGGGHLIDGAIHVVDAMRQVAGDIETVFAACARHRPELGAASEDTASLSMRFASGVLGQLFATHAATGRGGAPVLTLFGTTGCVSVGSPLGAVVAWYPGSEPNVMMPAYDWQDTFDGEIRNFVDAVNGIQQLRGTPRDGLLNLAVVLAAYRSAEVMAEVSVAEVLNG
ncbi:MAG: Gfo/Idh/MocA family oxidoreductase [Armatimonadetes bacterium]|nr:Gfo/Idh/MocA family oxidoreductase [Armatimonadota bacterium]MDE2207362.1 Gfo/Idh/MocA family oxidoreductase [Armatimonadota bacterium]